MKLKEALKIIKENSKKSKGYMIELVRFNKDKLEIDCFPDKESEELIKTEQKAWELAEQFAKATGNKYSSIRVVDENYNDINEYKEKLKPPKY